MHLIDYYPGHISKLLELNPKRVKNVFSINSDTFSSSCRTVVEFRLAKEPMFSPVWNPPETRVTFSRLRQLVLANTNSYQA